jgi:outer membrane protein W
MRYLLAITATVVVLLCSGPGARAAGEVIIKTGAFRLSESSQQLSDGTNLDFDQNASGVVGVEAGWRSQEGLALTGELLGYRNNWSSDMNISGHVDTGAVFFNIKKYFNAAHKVQPYLGIGLGYAGVDFSSQGEHGYAGDTAYQAMVGLAVRGKTFGFYSELNYLSSKPQDNIGDQIDVSGTGLFAGLLISF